MANKRRLIALCCGSRGWTRYGLIKREIAALAPSLIIHGACYGADMMSEAAAAQLHIPVRRFPANWKKYRKLAGRKRNHEMLDWLLSQDVDRIVVAFWDGISPGTGHMVWIACEKKVPVRVIHRDGVVQDVGPARLETE